jgi:hypothetical protein
MWFVKEDFYHLINYSLRLADNATIGYVPVKVVHV